MTKDGTQGTGNFIRRKQARCDLIKHRPEHMIVPLVDQSDANCRFTQTTRCRESSKTTPDNDHMRQHQLTPGVRIARHKMRYDARRTSKNKADKSRILQRPFAAQYS